VAQPRRHRPGIDGDRFRLDDLSEKAILPLKTTPENDDERA
jgi:hypothetical protein